MKLNKMQLIFISFWVPFTIFMLLAVSSAVGYKRIDYTWMHIGYDVLIVPIILNLFFMVVVVFGLRDRNGNEKTN